MRAIAARLNGDEFAIAAADISTGRFELIALAPGADERETISRVDRLLRPYGSIGAYGVNFHDNDLVPIDAAPAERDRLVREFAAAVSPIRPSIFLYRYIYPR